MNIKNFDKVRENAMNEFEKAVEHFKTLKTMRYDDIKIDKTMLVIVDMNKGFAKKGSLASPFVEAIIPGIANFAMKFDEDGGLIIAYTDCHTKKSLELKNYNYPDHCMKDTEETELVNELQQIESIIKIEKNSTNGFLAKNPLEVLEAFANVNSDDIENVYVVGCVTDICVKQFATTMKKYGEEIDKDLNIVVVEEFVDTFDIPGHDREYEHIIALNDMQKNGVDVVKGIEY